MQELNGESVGASAPSSRTCVPPSASSMLADGKLPHGDHQHRQFRCCRGRGCVHRRDRPDLQSSESVRRSGEGRSTLRSPPSGVDLMGCVLPTCEPCALSGADWDGACVRRGRAAHSRGGAAALRELAEKHAACATGEAPERSDLRAAAFCHAVRRFSFDPAVLPHMSNSPTELTGLAGRIALGS